LFYSVKSCKIDGEFFFSFGNWSNVFVRIWINEIKENVDKFLICNKDRIAFTLAEVLVTLTIIGVVSSMTIPTLYQRHTEQATVSKVKSAYAIVSNAIRMSIVDNGDFNTWDLSETWISDEELNQYFVPYLKTMGKSFKTKKDYGSDMKSLDNKSVAVYNRDLKSFLQLQNGMYFFVYYSGESKATIVIDINGAKKPNQVGIDVHYFKVDASNKVLPFYRTQPLNPEELSQNCNIKGSNTHNGKNCTEWVIYKGNMDYLRKEVSWN